MLSCPPLLTHSLTHSWVHIADRFNLPHSFCTASRRSWGPIWSIPACRTQSPSACLLLYFIYFIFSSFCLRQSLLGSPQIWISCGDSVSVGGRGFCWIRLPECGGRRAGIESSLRHHTKQLDSFLFAVGGAREHVEIVFCVVSWMWPAAAVGWAVCVPVGSGSFENMRYWQPRKNKKIILLVMKWSVPRFLNERGEISLMVSLHWRQEQL